MTQSKKKKKNQKNKRFRWGRVFKWLAIPFLTLFILVFAFAALLFASYVMTAPKLDMSKIQSQASTKILDKDGGVIATLGSENRVLVTTDQIPMTLVDAITSIEDHRFFEHRGIDQVRIAGSLLHNLQGETIQGGSTITQELIKLSFFSTADSDKTLKRKAEEAWLSIELEKKLTKEEIITLYVNKVGMNSGGNGMQTAAETFYNKPLSQLSLPQLALLAGMPQSPYYYDPFVNKDHAKARRDMVLEAMYRYGKISKADESAAINTPIDDGLQSKEQVQSRNTTIPLYLNNYITEVIKQVEADTGQNPTTTSMTVYTMLDNDAQRQLDQVFNTSDYVNYPDGQQVASTIVDNSTGAVIAQLGGRNQDNNSRLGDNPAVDTDRDWGSTMKPITDYAPAIDYGTYKTTAQMFDDSPYNFPGTSTAVNDWDNRYLGNITMRYALWQSRNIPATKALAAVGLNNSSTFLGKLGIKYYPDLYYANAFSSNTKTPSGHAEPEYGASSEKMAAAYSAFANGGNYTQPYYVSKVVYSDGTGKNLTPATNRVMKETTAYMITDMLKGVIPYGTNGSSFPPNKLVGLIQAGKTGTSNYADDQINQVKATSEFTVPDETFVGYTRDYTIATWTGYNDKFYPVQDILVPSEVYTSMMQYFYPDTSVSTDWTMPSGVNRYGSELYLDGATIPSSKTSSSSSDLSNSSSSSSGSSDGTNTSSSSDSGATTSSAATGTTTASSASSTTSSQ